MIQRILCVFGRHGEWVQTVWGPKDHRRVVFVCQTCRAPYKQKVRAG